MALNSRCRAAKFAQLVVLCLECSCCCVGGESQPSQFTCTFGGHAQGVLVVNTTTGQYQIGIHSSPLLSDGTPHGAPLRGAPYRIVRDGKWLSDRAGLTLESVSTLSGFDGNGAYSGLVLQWQTSHNSPHSSSAGSTAPGAGKHPFDAM